MLRFIPRRARNANAVNTYIRNRAVSPLLYFEHNLNAISTKIQEKALKYSPKSKKYFSNPKSPCKHDANMWCREQLGVGWQFHGSGMHPWQTGVACCRLQAIHTSTGDL